MTFTNKTINDVGMTEIATFIRENHKDGARIANDHSCISAWAAEAEESLDNGNPAMIEIRTFDSMTGAPITFTVSDAGIDIEEVEA